MALNEPNINLRTLVPSRWGRSMSRLESLRKTCAVLESCLEKFLKDYGFPRCPMQLVQLAFGKTLRIA